MRLVVKWKCFSRFAFEAGGLAKMKPDLGTIPCISEEQTWEEKVILLQISSSLEKMSIILAK